MHVEYTCQCVPGQASWRCNSIQEAPSTEPSKIHWTWLQKMLQKHVSKKSLRHISKDCKSIHPYNNECYIYLVFHINHRIYILITPSRDKSKVDLEAGPQTSLGISWADMGCARLHVLYILYIHISIILY